jgi:hypothetical protein
MKSGVSAKLIPDVEKMYGAENTRRGGREVVPPPSFSFFFPLLSGTDGEKEKEKEERRKRAGASLWVAPAIRGREAGLG